MSLPHLFFSNLFPKILSLSLLVGLSCQATAHHPVFSESTLFAVNPSVNAQINNGNGTLGETEFAFYSEANCAGTYSGIGLSGPVFFNYTSGNRYWGTFDFFYPDINTVPYPSIQLIIYDTSIPRKSATSPCLTATCTSNTACSFSPYRITLTFS